MSAYWDVDAILTDAQKVPCTFDLDVSGLGYLDGNAGGDVKKDAQVALPLWLGGYLAVQNFGTSVLSLDLPTALSPRVLNALKANPTTVDLRNQAPHFYDLAARCLELFEEDEMVDVLTETFKTRSAEIADHAHDSRGALGSGSDGPKGLDELERQLYRSSHQSSRAAQAWLGELQKRP